MKLPIAGKYEIFWHINHPQLDCSLFEGILKIGAFSILNARQTFPWNLKRQFPHGLERIKDENIIIDDVREIIQPTIMECL